MANRKSNKIFSKGFNFEEIYERFSIDYRLTKKQVIVITFYPKDGKQPTNSDERNW